MNVKTFGLIALLIVIASALLTFAVLREKPDSQSATSTQKPTSLSPTLPPSSQETVLTLTPSSLALSRNQKGSLDVFIQTNANQVTAVQLELMFDPQKITNVKVVEPNATAVESDSTAVASKAAFFENPFVLLNKVDKQKGRITYAVGVPPTGTPKQGTGIVATITFTSRLTSGETTSLTFLSETLVTATGTLSSVLKTTQNATISAL